QRGRCAFGGRSGRGRRSHGEARGPRRAPLKPALSKVEGRVLGCGESMSDGTRRSNQAAADSWSAKAVQSFWQDSADLCRILADQIRRFFARCARSDVMKEGVPPSEQNDIFLNFDPSLGSGGHFG